MMTKIGNSFHKLQLENGMILLAEEHPQVRSVSIGLWVKVGSYNELSRQNGISHFIEHLLFKGTKNRNSLEIASSLESLGGDLNAFTEKEVTCFHATVLSEHLKEALDVLSDIVLRPTFPISEFEKEKKVLLQELSMIEDSPEDKLYDHYFKSIWAGSPLGQPVIGIQKSIKNIKRSEVLSYYEQFYAPSNMVLSVAGNVPFEAVKKMTEKFFTTTQKQTTLSVPAKIPKYKTVKSGVSFPTDQLHMILGYEGFKIDSSYRYESLVLSFILGGGMSSRLFQEVREKEGLVYTIDCDLLPYSVAGVFYIYAAMAPRSLKKCLDIVRREIGKIKNAEVTEVELTRIKNQIKGAVLLSTDLMENRQESLARNEIFFQRYVSIEEVVNKIEDITLTSLNSAAQQLFNDDKACLILLSRKKATRKKIKEVFS